MRVINRINTVIFQRTKGAEWEMGLGLEFNDGENTLVDGEGNNVSEIWDCKDWSGIDIRTNVFEEFEEITKKKLMR